MADAPKTEMINPALLDGMSATFFVRPANGSEKSFPMKSMSMTVGRSDSCEIPVKDGSVSGRHAELCKERGKIIVRDLNSSNGVYVNGKKVEEAELADGDVLKLGQTTIRVEIAGGAKKKAAAAAPQIVVQQTGVSTGAIIGVIVGLLVVVGLGVMIFLVMRAKKEKREDAQAIDSFETSVNQLLAATPCKLVQDHVHDLARADVQDSQLKPRCSGRAEPSAAKYLASIKERGKFYDRIQGSIKQYTQQQQGAVGALKATTGHLYNPELRAMAEEVSAALDERAKGADTFAKDWRMLANDTQNFGSLAENVYAGKAPCQQLEAFQFSRQPPTILRACTQSYDRAATQVREKLKALDDAKPQVSGGAADDKADDGK